MVEGLILHYEIIEKLGEGGMGEVYKAKDTKLDRYVALKFLPSQLTATEEEKARFIQEAKTASSMNHPNVCTIYDIQELDGQLFIVMEYIEGKTLKDKVGSLSEKQKLEIGIQAAEGLAAAHEKGIVHRDIKPENIMIRKDGIVQIMDFGLAKLYTASNVSRLTKAGTTMGTMGYMSPEQVQGLDVDHRTDIFSLGIVLYEMFAGEPPFKGIHETAIMYEIVNVDPPPISAVIEGIDPELDRIILECLEKDKDERCQSAKELAKDLRKIKKSTGNRKSRVYTIGSTATDIRQVQAPKSSGSITVELMNHRYDLTKVFKLKYLSWLLAVIFLLVAIYALFFNSSENSNNVIRFEQLTDQSGEEIYPDISPDGNYITYTKSTGGFQHIFLQRIGAANAIDLTKGSQVDNYQSSFSPDGNQIVFRSERDGGGIFIMGSTGESVKRLTEFGYNPAWSPDGKIVLFATESIEHPYSRETVSQLFTVNMESGNIQKIYNGDAVQPSWSPNGKWIACWGLPKGTGKRVIYVMSYPVDKPIMITNDEYINWSPAWSFDGNYIFFSSNRGGSMNLWRVKFDEESGKILSGLEPLTTPSVFCEMMKFSRDGKKFIYVTAETRDNVDKLNIDPATGKAAGNSVPITEGTKRYLYPAISPDNKWIAAASTGQQEDLYLISTNGSSISRLTNDIFKCRGPAWSPDGKSIAFFADRTNKYEIWRINADGSNLAQLTKTSDIVITPIWFPNRHLMICNFINQKSIMFNPDSEMVTKFNNLPDYPEKGVSFYANSISPDGNDIAGYIVDVVFGESKGVVVYSMVKKEYQKYTSTGMGVFWFNDKKKLLYSDDKLFYVLDLSTKKAHPVTDIPLNLTGWWDYTLSPDNKTIYYIKEEKESDIWMGYLSNSNN